MAPEGWTTCLEYGKRLGFTEKELLTAGIIRQKEDTGRCYDQFRNRVTFTIENEQGRPVGFSARTLEAKPADGVSQGPAALRFTAGAAGHGQIEKSDPLRRSA